MTDGGIGLSSTRESMYRIHFAPRKLSDAEAVNTLPGYDTIEQEIETIRESANEQYTIRDKKSFAMYDSERANNTFAILGERGSGKTSVLLTLYKKLNHNKTNKPNNFVFPLIDLDSINENFNPMGCILSHLKKDMEELLEQIKKNYRTVGDEIKNTFFQNCSYKEDNILSHKFRKLVKNYLYSDSNYRKLLVQNYTDLNSYLKKSEQMFSASSEFQTDFYEYINELVKWKKSYYGTDNEEDQMEMPYTPLFMFLFDDIDMSPEKIMDLINILNQFMYHPNIVCFVSGDIHQMRKIVERKYRKRLLYSSKEGKEDYDRLREENEFERLSYDILSKTLPFFRRYSLSKWNNMTKPNFGEQTKSSDSAGSDEKGTLGELLVDITSSSEEKYLFGYSDNGNYHYFNQVFSLFPHKTRELLYTYAETVKLTKKEVSNRNYVIKSLLESLFDFLTRDSVDILEGDLASYLLWDIHNGVLESQVLMSKIKAKVGGSSLTDKTVLYYFVFALALLEKAEEIKELKQEYFSKNLTFSESVLQEYWNDIVASIPLHIALDWAECITATGDGASVKEKDMILGLVKVIKDNNLLDIGENPYYQLFHSSIMKSKFLSCIQKFVMTESYDGRNLEEKCFKALEDRKNGYPLSYLRDLCVNYYEENIHHAVNGIENMYGIGKGVGNKRKVNGIHEIEQLIIQNVKKISFMLEYGGDLPILGLKSTQDAQEKKQAVSRYYQSFADRTINSFLYFVCYGKEELVTVTLSEQCVQTIEKEVKEIPIPLESKTYSVKEFNAVMEGIVSHAKAAEQNLVHQIITEIVKNNAVMHVHDFQIRELMFGKPLEVCYYAGWYLSMMVDEMEEQKSMIRSWLEKQ